MSTKRDCYMEVRDSSHRDEIIKYAKSCGVNLGNRLSPNIKYLMLNSILNNIYGYKEPSKKENRLLVKEEQFKHCLKGGNLHICKSISHRPIQL